MGGMWVGRQLVAVGAILYIELLSLINIQPKLLLYGIPHHLDQICTFLFRFWLVIMTITFEHDKGQQPMAEPSGFPCIHGYCMS